MTVKINSNFRENSSTMLGQGMG